MSPLFMSSSQSRFSATRAGVIALFCAGILLQGLSNARAANLYWDGTDTTADADGGNGTWNTTNTNWDSAATAGSNSTWGSAANTNVAYFGGTGGTVTFGSDFGPSGAYPNAINITAGNYTFNLSGYGLAWRGTGFTVSSGATAILNNGTVDIAQSAASGLFNVTGSNALTINAKVTGANTTFSKSGAGGLILTNAANDFTGKLSGINGGDGIFFSSIANSGVASAAGAGSIIETGINNVMTYTGGAASTNRTLSFVSSGSGTLSNNGSGALTWTGAFTNTITAANTFNFGGNNTGANDFQGALVDSTNGGSYALSIAKAGTGTWILSGNNTYTGTTTISAGTLQIGSAGRLGGGSYAGAISNSGTFIYNSTNNQTLSGAITGSGALTKSNTSTLTLSNAGNNYNGTTSITAGTLTLSGSLTTNGAVAINGAANPVLNITGNLTSSYAAGGARALQIAASAGNTGTVNVSGSGVLNLTGGGMMLGENNGGNATFNQTGGTVTLAGSTTWMAGANSTINISGGNFSTGSNGFYIAGGTGANTRSTLTVNGTGIMRLGSLLVGQSSSGAGAVSTINIGDGTVGGGELVLGGLAYGSANVTHTFNFNGGTFTANANSMTINSSYTSVVKSGGAIFNVNPGFTFTVSGNLTSNGTDGGLTKNGTGTLTLSGAGGNYTGITTVNAGTLTLGANQNLGAIAGAGALNLSSYTLTTNATSNTTYSGVISGTGALTKNGTSTLTLTGNNTYNGVTTINAGTLAVDGAGRLGGGNYTANLTNAGTFLYNGTNDQTLSGNLSGAGALTKNNTSTLTLTGSTISNTGAVTINAGNLTVNNSASSLTLGTVTGAGNFNATVGTYFMNGNITTTGTVTIATAGPGSGGVRMSSSNNGGARTITANAITVTGQTGDSFGAGTLTFDTSAANGNIYLDLANGWGGTFYNNNITANAGTGTLTIAGTNGANANAGQGWGGTNNLTGALNISTNLSSAGSGGGGIWNLTATGNSTISGNLKLGAGAATNTWTVNPGLTMNASGVISGTGNLTKNGTGILILGGVNTYNGTTTINAGTLQIGDAGQLGSGTYAQNISNNGTFLYNSTANQTLSGVVSGTGALTKNGTGTLTLSNAANTYNGATTINAGTLAVSGNISSSAITLNSNAVISAGTVASIAKFNAASLTIAGDSGYAFTIGNISGGTVGAAGTDFDQIATSGAITFNNTVANPFTVYINGTPTNWSSSGSYTWNILSGSSLSGFSSGNFVADYSAFGGAMAAGASWTFGSSGGNLTLTYGTSGTPTWAGGTGVWTTGFSPALTNNLDMLFTGAGGTATNDIASGTLSSVGSITFNSTAGSYTLAANSGSAGNGSALNVAGSIVNNSANAQTINNALAFTGVRTINTASGNITLGGVVSGAGGITKNGSSTLTLTGNNTYTGATTISAGTLQIGGGGLLGGGNYSNTISNNGTLLYTSTANQTLSGIISGSGALTQNATGVLTLSGNNTYSGATTITAGTLQIGGAGQLGSGTYAQNISNNGTFLYASTANQTLSGVISGTGALTQNAASTLTLSGNNTYTGATTISAGTVLIGAAGRLGAGNYTGNISNSAALVNTGTNNQTFSGVISGIGALTQNAASTLILSGNNSYSGGTTLTTGTIQVTSATGLGTGNLTAAANTRIWLDASAGARTFSNNISTASGASGALYFSGNVTTTGLVTISAGVDTREAVTSNWIVAGGISSANNSGIAFNLATTINSTISIGTGDLTFTSTGHRFNTAGHTYGNTTISFGGNLTLGVADALPSSTKVRFGWSNAGNSPATLNLNGYNLTVASLEGTLGNYDTQNQNITGGGVLTVNQTAAQGFSYGGRITDGATATSLTKNGSGTLMLQNWSGTDSTYSGATTINAGTLMILAGNGTSLSAASAYTVGSGAVLSINGTSQGIASLAGAGTVQNGNASTASVLTIGANNSNSTFSGIIQNGGAAALGITKNGTGTLTFSNTNTYTGNTTVNAGTLALGANQTLGAIAGAGNINLSTYNLSANSTSSTTFSGVVSGSGAFTKAGTGTTTLSGNNTYTGATTVNGGTLQIGAGGTTGSISSSASIVNNGTITFNRTDTVTQGTDFNSVISGSGNLTQSGSGTLVLGASNTYTGATTVNGGTLQLTGNISSSALTVGTGGLISIGNTTATAKYNASSITIQGGSGYAVTLASANGTTAGTDFDQLTATGALTLSNTAASPFTVYLYGTPTGWSSVGTYSWNIISAASQTGFNSGNFAVNLTNFGIASSNRTGTWAFTNPSGGNITLTYTLATPDYIWDGGTGNWTDSYSAGVRGFTPANPTVDDNLYFTGAGGTVTNTMANSTISSVNFITFNSTAGAYTLNATTGAAGVAGGTALTVKGDIINNSASNQAISMNLTLGGSSTGIVNTAAGNITISGGISGTGGLTKEGNRTLTLSAVNSYSGATTVNNGTLVISAQATTGSLVINSGATASAGLNTLNNFSSITINGGTLTPTHFLRGFAGALTMTNGTISAGGDFAAGSYTLYGNNTIATTITDRGATFNVVSGTTTVSGAIQFYYGGALIKNGNGTLTLSGANNYPRDSGSSTTTLNAGTLNLNSATALGGANTPFTINGGTLDNTSGAAITLTNNNTQNWNGDFTFTGTRDLNMGSGNITMNASRTVTVSAGNFTTSGVISGTGYTLTKNGSGMLTINASNTIGAKTVNGGTLRIVAAGNVPGIGASNNTVNLNNGSTLQLGYTGGNNPAFHGAVVNIDSTGGATIVNDGLNGLIQGGTGGWFTINTNGGAQSQLTSLNGGYYNNQSGGGGILFNVASGNNATADVLVSVATTGGWGITKNGTGKVLITSNLNVNGIFAINGGTVEFGGSSAPTLTNTAYTITNNGTLSFNSTANVTISQNITGTGNLTKDNTSTLTLSGAGTNYSGLTTITAGTLAISNNMTIGAITGGGNLSLGTGFTLTTNSTSNSTFSGVISGAGALSKAGTGALTLNGTNTFSGGVTLNAGTIQIAHANGLGTSGNITFSGGGLQYGSGITTDISSRIKNSTGAVLIDTNSNNVNFASAVDSSNTLGLTKNGTGILTLSGNNTYTGTTTINTGTVVIGAAGRLGGGNYTGNIVNNGTFIYSGTANQTLGGNISGTGALTHNASSTLTLTGSNSYNGATTVSAGTLVLNGNNSASAVTIDSGATLKGSGSAGATTVSGTISPGNSPGTLSVGALTLNSGGVYTWEMADATGVAGTGWDQIASSGLLTINSTSGSTFTIAITSTGAPTNWNYQTANQSWDIITYGTISGFDATKFSINATAFGGTLGGAASTWALIDTGSALRLTYTYAADPIWAGGTGNWTTGFSPAITNSANATFTGVGGTATNNIASATLSTLGTFTFNSTAGAYTLDANSGSSGYDAASAFTLAGNIINNSNATQTINIAITSNATRVYDAAAGNITIGGSIAGTGGLTKNGSNTLTLSGNNTYTGDTTINAGTLTITSTGLLGGGNYSGNISNSGTFNYASSANQTLGGIISGNGALTKDGASNLTLTGVNTFSGATTITAGTLTIGGAGQLGSGNYSGNIANNGILAYNSSANQTLGGTISGTGDLIKNGTGTLTLTNANTYNGSTTITAGTLSVSAANGLGATTEVTIDGGSLLVAASNVINDSADITMGNNGTLILSGSVGEVVGQFSLTTNTTAIIDMGYTASWISFWKFASQLSDDTKLWIYNYTVGSDHVYIRDDTNGNVAASLPNITFFSDFGSTSLGNGFFDAPEVHPHIVPEPETYATAALLLLGLGIYAYRRRRPTLDGSGV